ncbi:MAG TPA: ABC transporter permease [Candidatus Limnocylindrales bacterium]|nr:ABC transporter permease [Candidatus Limnocylindrales bacterium]
MTANRLWRLLLLPGGLWLVLLFVVPFGVVIAVSLGTTDILGRPVYGWHPENYTAVFDPIFLPVLLRSAVFAIATTVLCLLIGYPVAYMIARYGGRYRNLLVVLIILPWFADYLVRIYAWFVILGDQGIVNGLLHLAGLPGTPPIIFLNTPMSVIGGLVYDYLPYMVLPIYAALERMDPALIEAGKDLYGSPARTFWHVTWPYTLSGVIAGAVLVGLPAVGDFATAQILGGPKTYMIGNLIQDSINTGDWPFGAALTVVLMAILSLIMLLYIRSASRQVQALG